MIEIPVSIGEIFDKITILELKQIYILDPVKVKNVTKELELLYDKVKNVSIDALLLSELKDVNQKLWNIEDQIRIYESIHKFDDEFIELARAVYITNDKRAELKRQINFLSGSKLIEEKSYIHE
jgi:hypothetical protein